MKKCIVFSFFISLLLVSNSSIQAQDYYAYVAAESEDEVHLVHYNAESGKLTIDETIMVGRYPAETDGPHGLTVSPDGKHWFVSIAHGNPYGWLAKYSTETNRLVATTDLGMFPASMEISPLTGLLYVVNFNLHGEMVPSTVSVVDPEAMIRLDDIDTGIMPHGSRLSPDGTKQYHVSMMTDELIEIDAVNMEVSRRFKLSKSDHSGMGHGNMDHSDHSDGNMKHNPVEKPTWAHPHPTKPLVYVAANGSDEVIEVNTDNWEITRRFQTSKAPYNLEVTPDGSKLVVSYKGDASTGVWDLESGKELAKLSNSRKVTHGVSITPDSRFAFITVEGIGGEPGSVEIVDLETLEITDIIETGKQAGGIYFWKMVN